MSGVVPPLPVRQATATKLCIGLLRLTDGAPVIVAHELGFFADESLDVELVVEPSWANVADKLAFGFFDAAVVMPPLAFAIQLGMRGAATPLLIPYMLSAGGNTITLARSLAQETRDRTDRGRVSTVEALAACLRERQTTLGVVHAYSTHNLLLRYWLATAGIEAGRDVKLAVVPPARAVEALAAGQIAGFCAGAPWGEVARRAGAGITVATSTDVWQNAPEKALAVRADWAADHPGALAGAMRALLRAAKFCDDPQNAAYTAALLSRGGYLDVDPHAILAGLPGGTKSNPGCVFFRGAASFPWRSHGLWFLTEMRRWRLIDHGIDLRGLVERVYRPDIYRAAVAILDEPVPIADWKREGAHREPWLVDAAPVPITMPADSLCDGAVFDPTEVPAAALALTSALHNL